MDNHNNQGRYELVDEETQPQSTYGGITSNTDDLQEHQHQTPQVVMNEDYDQLDQSNDTTINESDSQVNSQSAENEITTNSREAGYQVHRDEEFEYYDFNQMPGTKNDPKAKKSKNRKSQNQANRKLQRHAPNQSSDIEMVAYGIPQQEFSQEQMAFGEPVNFGIPEGRELDDSLDFQNLPRHPVLTNCPFCGHTGETVVKKDKLDLVLKSFLLFLKLLMCVLFSALIVLVCVLFIMMACKNEGGNNNHMDCGCGWWLCWHNHNSSTSNDCCCCGTCCGFGSSEVRKIHSCSNCNETIGVSK